MLDIESLLSENELLKLQLASSHTLISRKEEKLIFYESENARLLEMLRLAKIHLYGRKSERWESEEQIRLFNEVEEIAKNAKDEDDGDESTIDVKGHTKKRGKRGPLPKHL